MLPGTTTQEEKVLGSAQRDSEWSEGVEVVVEGLFISWWAARILIFY
jgi:hypothetical protein